MEFRDNGTGIDKEDISSVFNPFFSRKSKGTGLGLTICKELIELHGGEIKLESEKNSGTTVKIIIPARSNASNE